MHMKQKKWLHALALTACAGLAQAAERPLEVVAQTHDAIWNAVAVDDADNVYVAGPRWTGMKGPSVSRLDANRRPQAFPDARWNSTDNSIPVSERFVNVNALHRDDQGQMWIVDAGVSDFGGHVIPGAAKLVVVDLHTGKTTKVITFNSDVIRDGSYIDDIRFSGDHAYLTDAGVPGIIVLDLKNDSMRRVLDTSPAVKAPADRDIVLSGKVVRAPNGKALRVNSDPLETSHDGKWLYFAALEGPWYRIETRWLNDPKLSPAVLAEKIEFWRDLPPVGGTALDKQGNFYFSDLATDTVKRIRTSGKIETIVSDPSLHWVDAPTFDREGRLYLPAAQVDRVALFNEGVSRVQWPLRVYRFNLDQ
ncbi:L-dopachrome tautomerase-related protein [Pseudomonas sp. Pseu.R1]|uniref:L-dopachrome tautomerase-related protein n=1 Tax=Pseudomonas sp. Pseu.R1 TaxID=3379818 RepID=UPI003B953CBA